jgi:hypothetical protein
MFLHCVKLAKERNCGRLEWAVLDWNPARKFYEHLGGSPVDGWHIYRMDEEKFESALEKSNCGRPPQPKGWGMLMGRPPGYLDTDN